MKKLKKILIALMSICIIFSHVQPVEVHAVAKMSLAQLRAKFPHGKYWNHVGSKKNNPDGWTNNPCRHHGVEESGCSF
ncbi:MAG: hypothetical protein IJD85_04100, partial [Oscillospiraceae bacterium]|nr:hypothetical protein [Oscillospiraceae bacterium]